MSNTTIDEIADHVYRITTLEPYGPPGGLTFNQFLIDDHEPVLIHTGMRAHAADVIDAAATVMPPARLRWITSNHASRPDEFGALDHWFAVAPHAEVVHGETGCFVNLADISERSLRAIGDGDLLEVGAHKLRWYATPHVPGPWEAGFWFDETQRILFTGDVFAQPGPTDATTTGDIVAGAVAHDTWGHGTALTPTTAPTLRALARLGATTLALMHGPTYVGDGTTPLKDLADHYEHEQCDANNPPGMLGQLLKSPYGE
jgi:flavorubredoxin